MALSSFIKQLLETDTVFGSEAKKMTGINDAVIKVAFADIEISFNVVNGILQFTIHNYVVPLQNISWLNPGKYIIFNFIKFDRSNSVTLNLLEYEARLFQISTVVQSNSNLIITFNKDAEGTPDFSKLVDIDNLSPVTVRLDGRIFALIGDPDIARVSSSGATMFNVDNMSTTGLAADSSGIARKFASHYHTDITSEAVFNDKDEEGRDLARIVIDDVGVEQFIGYDENIARAQALADDADGAGIRVEARIFSGNFVTVAQYGKIGQISNGRLTTLVGVPWSERVDMPLDGRAETFSVNLLDQSITLFPNVDPNVIGPGILLPIPIAGSADITIDSTPANLDRVYIIPIGGTKVDANAYQAVTTAGTGTVDANRQFVIETDDADTAQNLLSAIQTVQPLINPSRVGTTVSIYCTFTFRTMLGSIEIDAPSPYSFTFDPGATNEGVVKLEVANRIITILNDRLTRFDFTRVTGTGTDQNIFYAAKETGPDPLTTTRPGPPAPFPDAFGPRLFPNNGRNGVPLSGNEFFTLDDLRGVLRAGTSANVGAGFEFQLPVDWTFNNTTSILTFTVPQPTGPNLTISVVNDRVLDPAPTVTVLNGERDAGSAAANIASVVNSNPNFTASSNGVVLTVTNTAPGQVTIEDFNVEATDVTNLSDNPPFVAGTPTNGEVATEFDFETIGFTDSFRILTNADPSKLISFFQSTSSTIFTNLNPDSTELTELPVINKTYNGVKIGAPKLVFDNNGSVVFNLPTTIYPEGTNVVP